MSKYVADTFQIRQTYVTSTLLMRYQYASCTVHIHASVSPHEDWASHCALGWIDNKETEVSTMAVPAVIRMGEILNRAQSSIRTETVVHAHTIQSEGQHPLGK